MDLFRAEDAGVVALMNGNNSTRSVALSWRVLVQHGFFDCGGVLRDSNGDENFCGPSILSFQYESTSPSSISLLLFLD
jgi:hypothetical protein